MKTKLPPDSRDDAKANRIRERFLEVHAAMNEDRTIGDAMLDEFVYDLVHDIMKSDRIEGPTRELTLPFKVNA